MQLLVFFHIHLPHRPITFARSINYDEKDPFLCNTCGFCKYAKFEMTLTARSCSAVDPIESEEDRNKVRSCDVMRVFSCGV